MVDWGKVLQKIIYDLNLIYDAISSTARFHRPGIKGLIWGWHYCYHRMVLFFSDSFVPHRMRERERERERCGSSDEY